jgi:CMP-2-keto-3-deoxyoctulosonic acid synthetase
MSNYRPPCKSVADYFDQVVKIGEKYDVSRVFLATDDESVVQYMRAVYADVC